MATARLENLREGVQLCEARIAIESALLDPARKRKLGGKLAQECEALLDERQRAMWKTVWRVQEDLDKEGVVRARNPIESLWTSWTKKDTSLPGFWDSAARKARRDASAEGLVWFAASDWQAREEMLFTLAGKVDKKLGITRARKGARRTRTVASRPRAPKRTSKPPARTPTRTAAASELAEMRQVVIDGVKGGRKEQVGLKMGRGSLRGQVVGADEKGITIRTRGGMQMSVPWSSLPAEKLAALAKSYQR